MHVHTVVTLSLDRLNARICCDQSSSTSINTFKELGEFTFSHSQAKLGREFDPDVNIRSSITFAAVLSFNVTA
jgi:hypothetical protein